MPPHREATRSTTAIWRGRPPQQQERPKQEMRTRSHVADDASWGWRCAAWLRVRVESAVAACFCHSPSPLLLYLLVHLAANQTPQRGAWRPQIASGGATRPHVVRDPRGRAAGPGVPERETSSSERPAPLLQPYFLVAVAVAVVAAVVVVAGDDPASAFSPSSCCCCWRWLLLRAMKTLRSSRVWLCLCDRRPRWWCCWRRWFG